MSVTMCVSLYAFLLSVCSEKHTTNFIYVLFSMCIVFAF